jgi:hypothetical protein
MEITLAIKVITLSKPIHESFHLIAEILAVKYMNLAHLKLVIAFIPALSLT